MAVSTWQVPLGEDRTVLSPVEMHISVFILSCDFKAKVSLSPTPGSHSSRQYCPGCNFDKRDPEMSKPFSFISGCGGTGRRKWKLRSHKSVLTSLDAAFRIRSAKVRQRYLRAAGLSPTLTSVCMLLPIVVPFHSPPRSFCLVCTTIPISMCAEVLSNSARILQVFRTAQLV